VKASSAMSLTRPFRETVEKRIQKDPAFAAALWHEAAQLFVEGEPSTARLLLRDLVAATVGFEELAERTGKSRKILRRLLSASGNPTMGVLLAVFAAVKPNDIGIKRMVASTRQMAV
jgi:DNA-binding phage protein